MNNFCESLNWLTLGMNDMKCYNLGQVKTSKVTSTSKNTVIDDIRNIKNVSCYDAMFDVAMSDA